MSTFSGTPGADGDDGYDGTGFDNANVEVQFGDQGTANMRTFVRFPNVTIANGSTITAASIDFIERFTNTDVTCNVNVYFQLATNPAAPTSSGEMDTAFAAATSAVAWNAVPAANQDDVLTTPSLVSILQSVVNQGGFASGNAVLALVQNNGSSTNAYRRLRTHVAGAPLSTLNVTYTVGGRATKNTRAFPLGTELGMGFRMNID